MLLFLLSATFSSECFMKTINQKKNKTTIVTVILFLFVLFLVSGAESMQSGEVKCLSF